MAPRRPVACSNKLQGGTCRTDKRLCAPEVRPCAHRGPRPDRPLVLPPELRFSQADIDGCSCHADGSAGGAKVRRPDSWVLAIVRRRRLPMSFLRHGSEGPEPTPRRSDFTQQPRTQTACGAAGHQPARRNGPSRIPQQRGDYLRSELKLRRSKFHNQRA